MRNTKRASVEAVDGFLKGLLVLSRTVDHVLESHAVKRAVGEKLSGTRAQILRLLGQGRRRTASQVARYLGVTKPAVTQVVDSLVRQRLVRRVPATRDRREVHLRLTDKGRKFLRSIQQTQRETLRAVFQGVSQRDFERWQRLLEQLAVRLLTAGEKFETFCAQCEALGDGTCIVPAGKGKGCPMDDARPR